MLLTACGKQNEKTIHIFTNSWIGYAPLFYAKEKGYFDKLNIDLVTNVSLAEAADLYDIGKADLVTTTQHEYYSLKNSGHNIVPVILFDRSRVHQQRPGTDRRPKTVSRLYNRLSLVEKINWLISKNKRSHSKFALLFLDLDNFKNINNSRGHEFGDKVLRHVAHVLLNSVRDNDIVSRLGGDEFVIVLPDIEDNEAILEVIYRISDTLSKPVIFDDGVENAEQLEYLKR